MVTPISLNGAGCAAAGPAASVGVNSKATKVRRITCTSASLQVLADAKLRPVKFRANNRRSRLASETDRERHVDHGFRAPLEGDACLNVGAEAPQPYFETIGANRQACDGVRDAFSRDGVPL